MPEAERVLIPLVNPNEPEALIAQLAVAEGQAVSVGDLLCTLETTKSTLEVVAAQSGYVIGMQFDQGALARAGDTLCWIGDREDWRPPVEVTPLASSEDDQFSGLRITQPARMLVERRGVALEKLPRDLLITESVVKGMLEDDGAAELAVMTDPKAVVVYGGGGHGKALIDMIRKLGGYELVGVIDDRIPAGQTVLGLKVLGDGLHLRVLDKKGIRQAVNAVGGIGDVMSRVRVFKRLEAEGFSCPTLVHPTAFVEDSAHISDGVQVFPHAYVGSDASLGYGVIVNTGAVVSHDCQIDPYANLAPGVLIAGSVRVGERVLIGMGVTVNLNVVIGAGARVGNSAVIKEDVPSNAVIPAGSIWPPRGQPG